MVDKQEVEKLLEQLNEWDEQTALYKYPQSILNIICNRFNPMKTITLGQPPDIIIGPTTSSGPSALNHYIDINGHKIYMKETVKELKDYLNSLSK